MEETSLVREAAVVDEPWASSDFSYARVKAILDFTACSSLGRSGLGLRGWLDRLCRVGSGSGSIPGSRLPQLIGCFLTFEPRLFTLGGLKWPGAAPTTSKGVLS